MKLKEDLVMVNRLEVGVSRPSVANNLWRRAKTVLSHDISREKCLRVYVLFRNLYFECALIEQMLERQRLARKGVIMAVATCKTW